MSGIQVRRDPDDRFSRIWGRLPVEEATLVEKAFEARMTVVGPDPESGSFPPVASQYADALVEIASLSLGGKGELSRPMLVIHAQAEALTSGEGWAELEGGPAIPVDVVRRLACDGYWQVVASDVEGRTLGVGRATRSIPRWLLRELRHRDVGCRFPGCRHTRWVQGHHIIHWVDGGPTEMGNLCLLCGRHHKFLHDHGWRLEGDPFGELRFIRPDGEVLVSGPTPLRPGPREWFENLLWGSRPPALPPAITPPEIERRE